MIIPTTIAHYAHRSSNQTRDAPDKQAGVVADATWH